MEKLKRKVLKTVTNYSLLPKNSKVLVALSGGPDSVSLLHVLLELRRELSIEVAAAHINHMLRGEESERDEDFVRKLCKEWKVKLFVERVNVPEISKGRNVEAVARGERYKKLKEILGKWKGDLIALGHTASDLTETVILNLTKGSGLKGLRGFLPKRDVFVRPLFEVTREEVEEYVKERELPFVIDSSNLEKRFERNLIRIDVIPVLKRINPSLEESILRETEILRGVEEFIEFEVGKVIKRHLTENKFCIPIEEAKEIHPFLLSEVVREAYRRLSSRELSFKKVKLIEKLLKKEGYGEVHIDDQFRAYRNQHSLCIDRRRKTEKFSYRVEQLPAKVETPLFTLSFYKNRGIPILPLSEFEGKGIIVRSRKPGDRLEFKGFSKKLKKFFIERRVPAEVRDLMPVVESSGRIIFIPDLYVGKAESPEFVGVEFEQTTKGPHPGREDSKQGKGVGQGDTGSL